MPTWITIILSLISGIGGAILTIFANELIFKPILTLNKTEDKFYSHITDLSHHRFIVQNEGMRVANNCTASLTLYDIEQVDVSNTYKKAIIGPDNFGEEPKTLSFMGLYWAGAGTDSSGKDNPVSISINKQSCMMIDICSTPKGLNPPLIYICSEWAGIHRINLVVAGKRCYRGQILLTGSNANHRKINFRFVPKYDENNSIPTDIDLIIDNVEPETWPRFFRHFKYGQ